MSASEQGSHRPLPALLFLMLPFSLPICPPATLFPLEAAVSVVYSHWSPCTQSGLSPCTLQPANAPAWPRHLIPADRHLPTGSEVPPSQNLFLVFPHSPAPLYAPLWCALPSDPAPTPHPRHRGCLPLLPSVSPCLKCLPLALHPFLKSSPGCSSVGASACQGARLGLGLCQRCSPPTSHSGSCAWPSPNVLRAQEDSGGRLGAMHTQTHFLS